VERGPAIDRAAQRGKEGTENRPAARRGGRKKERNGKTRVLVNLFCDNARVIKGLSLRKKKRGENGRRKRRKRLSGRGIPEDKVMRYSSNSRGEGDELLYVTGGGRKDVKLFMELSAVADFLFSRKKKAGENGVRIVEGGKTNFFHSTCTRAMTLIGRREGE